MSSDSYHLTVGLQRIVDEAADWVAAPTTVFPQAWFTIRNWAIDALDRSRNDVPVEDAEYRDILSKLRSLRGREGGVQALV